MEEGESCDRTIQDHVSLVYDQSRKFTEVLMIRLFHPGTPIIPHEVKSSAISILVAWLAAPS